MSTSSWNQSASASTPDEALAALRHDLDAIDTRLLETIHARLQCCERIGHHKK